MSIVTDGSGIRCEGKPGFFDVDDRLKRLSDLGDQLEAFSCGRIRGVSPGAALTYSDGTQGGRPPFDPMMMFNILVIQTTNNLSDERAEFLIGCHSCVFSDLDCRIASPTPGRLFREKLTKAGAIGPLFERFDATLRQSGYIAMAGQIVDAGDPRSSSAQHPEEGDQGRAHPRRLERQAREAQKDRDARWTVKYTKAKPREDGSTPPVGLAIPVFGDQNHISLDRGFGFIRKWSVTDAAAMRAAVCAMDFSTRPTRRAASGRTQHQIGRQRGVHGKERLRQPCPS